MREDGSVDPIIRSNAQYATLLDIAQGFSAGVLGRASGRRRLPSFMPTGLAGWRALRHISLPRSTTQHITHHTRCPDTLGRERGHRWPREISFGCCVQDGAL